MMMSGSACVALGTNRSVAPVDYLVTLFPKGTITPLRAKHASERRAWMFGVVPLGAYSSAKLILLTIPKNP